MSIASEITRLSGVRNNIFNSIQNKGVNVPAGSTYSSCPALIDSIVTGSGGEGATALYDTNFTAHSTFTANGIFNADQMKTTTYDSLSGNSYFETKLQSQTFGIHNLMGLTPYDPIENWNAGEISAIAFRNNSTHPELSSNSCLLDIVLTDNNYNQGWDPCLTAFRYENFKLFRYENNLWYENEYAFGEGGYRDGFASAYEYSGFSANGSTCTWHFVINLLNYNVRATEQILPNSLRYNSTSKFDFGWRGGLVEQLTASNKITVNSVKLIYEPLSSKSESYPYPDAPINITGTFNVSGANVEYCTSSQKGVNKDYSSYSSGFLSGNFNNSSTQTGTYTLYNSEVDRGYSPSRLTIAWAYPLRDIEVTTEAPRDVYDVGYTISNSGIITQGV